MRYWGSGNETVLGVWESGRTGGLGMRPYWGSGNEVVPGIWE